MNERKKIFKWEICSSVVKMYLTWIMASCWKNPLSKSWWLAPLEFDEFFIGDVCRSTSAAWMASDEQRSGIITWPFLREILPSTRTREVLMDSDMFLSNSSKFSFSSWPSWLLTSSSSSLLDESWLSQSAVLLSRQANGWFGGIRTFNGKLNY